MNLVTPEYQYIVTVHGLQMGKCYTSGLSTCHESQEKECKNLIRHSVGNELSDK